MNHACLLDAEFERDKAPIVEPPAPARLDTLLDGAEGEKLSGWTGTTPRATSRCGRLGRGDEVGNEEEEEEETSEYGRSLKRMYRRAGGAKSGPLAGTVRLCSSLFLFLSY